MKTVDMSWVGCSEEWYGTVSDKNVTPLYKALERAQKAIDTVTTAGDIGVLNVGTTLANLEELNANRRKLVSFCNAIHYEINQMVDNPFSVQQADLLQAAYDLNPSDFEAVTGKTLWWDKKESLEDLLKSTMTDESLQSDFSSKVKALNEDKPSGDLQDAMKEARFWENEFEKSNECQRIADSIFTPDVRANWPNMTEAERKKVLEEYAGQIGEVLYGTDTITVKYDANGFGYSDYSNKTIGINPDFITDPAGNYSVDKLIDTTTHEMRHQYQGWVKSNPDQFGISDSLKAEWEEKYKESKHGYSDYYAQEVERDARGFAALSSPE